MKQYDAIIIGFGKGGKLLAAELANRNWKVAIIERSSQMYGGTCVNAGCIPTKTLIHESEQAEWLYRDNYDSQAKFYTSAVSRKNKLVSFLRDKNHEHLKSYPNITLYDGGASFMSNDTVKVAHDKKEILLQGKEIFINTGSTPILPDVEGLNESKHAFTSETLLRQSVLPKHLLILGAGTIGMEFATMYAGFGSRVTLLESGNRFMPKSDRDIAESMLEALKRKGIEVRLNVHALSMYDTANGMTLTYTDNSDGTPYFLEGDALLLATGRRAMTDGLNLHAAGVQTDAQGAIVVNGHLQTTSPHIWAMGDVRGGSMYDYLSIDDFRIITNHLFGNKKRNMDDRLPGALRHLYGPSLGTHRHHRRGSRKARLLDPSVPAPGCRHSACPHPATHRRHAESYCQCTYGPHHGMHPVLRRCARSHQPGGISHEKRPALQCPARFHLHTPQHERRIK